MKVRNSGPWPLAYFDDDAGRLDMPIGVDVEVPDRIGNILRGVEGVTVEGE